MEASVRILDGNLRPIESSFFSLMDIQMISRSEFISVRYVELLCSSVTTVGRTEYLLHSLLYTVYIYFAKCSGGHATDIFD